MTATTILLEEAPNGVLQDSAGNALVGHQIYVYQRGTSTQVQVYSDSAATIPLSQPLITSATGAIPGYVLGEQTLDLYDATTGQRVATDVVAAADVASGIAGALQKANNLSDLANVATARTNLGLGSAATQPSSAFDTAGAAAAAQAASLQKSANLSDVADPGSSRANLRVPVLSPAACVATANVSALSGLPTIDGYTVQNSDLILLTAQTTGSQNGLWQAPASGTGAWTRPSEFPAGGVVKSREISVINGTVYTASRWLLATNASLVIDTGTQTWTEFPTGAGGGSSTLAGDTDVSISSPAKGQALVYNGTRWVNGLPYRAETVKTAAYTLAATDDVILADATGQQPPFRLAPPTFSGTGSTFSSPGVSGYYWTVTATGPSGESLGPHSACWGLPGAGQNAVLTWLAASGATGYKVYRCPFNIASPMANTPQLVATLGNVLTYTDTGTATTASSPPSSNGGAFTLTLPDATSAGVGAGKTYRIKATTQNGNLVTVATTGGQTIDGASTLKLGIASAGLEYTTGAQYRSVDLISDGTNWRIMRYELPPVYHGQAVDVYTVSCPVGSFTPCVVVPVPGPGLLHGQTAKITMTGQYKATAGVTSVRWLGIWCTNSQSALATTPATYQQMSFWDDDTFSPGERKTFSTEWQYNPRFGDWCAVNDGLGFIGLFGTAYGSGSVSFYSTSISIQLGAVAETMWPTP